MDEVAEFIRDLGDDDSDVRYHAAHMLSITHMQSRRHDGQWVTVTVPWEADETAVGPLIIALKDSVWQTRGRAAEALGKIGDTRAVEPLIGALSDEEDLVRCDAAEALGKIGDTRAVQPLFKAVKYGSEGWAELRHSAADALVELGEGLAVAPVLAELNEARDEEVQ